MGEANASVLLGIQAEVCAAREESVVTIWVGQCAGPRGPELLGGGNSKFPLKMLPIIVLAKIVWASEEPAFSKNQLLKVGLEQNL